MISRLIPRRLRTPLLALALLTLVAPALASCGTSTAGGASGGEQKLTVLAAASLTEPFTELARTFEARHPGVRVATGFDSSATLAEQVDAGAPADVVATADTKTMETMRKAGVLRSRPVVFARNRLALVVPSGNPAGITGLADLEHADYVVCVRSAPCGGLAADLLAKSGITNPPRSNEVDVKAVLTKVQLDEADAGLVYASDAVAAGKDVREIPLPKGTAPATDYPIAIPSATGRPDLAQAWVDLVRSPEGQRVLARDGFATDAGTGASG